MSVVTALDTNILVYAHRQDSVFHNDARRLVAELAEGAAPWAIPWPCVYEFLSIVTHPRALAPPTPLASAIGQINIWMESPSLVLLTETPDLWKTLSRILERGRISGPRVHDARIAALCLQHNVDELWSADRDFNRFPDLKVVNPLLSLN